MKNRIVSLVLTVFFLISLLPAVPFAEEVSATYVFSNGLRGDGEGTLTFQGLTGYGKVCLYFTTEYGLYEDCEPVAVQTVSSMRAVFTLPRAFLLPPEVTGFALFYEADAQSPALENACAVYALPEDKLFGEADPAFTFASVSDVHVNYDDNGYGASKKWTNALDFFDLMEIDSVVISGDITGSGTQTEYNRYRSAVSASYVAPERIYEAQGNHDATQVARFLEYTQGEDDVHPFEGSAWFYVLKEGENGARDNLFIFMAQELSSTSATPNVDNFSTRQLDWVEGLLETYAGTDTNIFIIEHAMIRNFGPGDKYNGVYVEPMYFKDAYPGNMRFKSLLTTYKEAIMMSGHTHLSLREGYNFGDENGTAARMIHNSSISQPRSYTSSGTISYNSEGRTTETAGSEGYLVYVYDDCATYVGYDLTAQKIIPTASYLIPLYSEDRASAQSIAVTAPPVKTVYDGGECFDASGMVVTATYADGTTAEVKGWGLSKVGALSSSDKSVSVTYGNCAPVAVPVTVGKGPSVHGEGELQGSGTKTDPFLVSSAADFAALTKCFNASTSSGGACGTGKFYRQTADIDMTGYPSYEGTHANGDAKCYFAGIYDGAGHTLTVNVSSSGQTSVFPYITGALLNLKIKGSISSSTSAQPVRTVQPGAVIANCVFDMTLTSSKGNGVSYSIYGTLFNVYVTGVGTNAVYNTNSNGQYYHAYTNMKNASGSVLTHSKTVASDDLDAIAAAFNDRTDSAFTSGTAALKAVNASLDEKALGEVSVKDGELILSPGELSGEEPPAPVYFEGSGTAEDPYLIASAADFKKLTDLFCASTSSSSPYGAGLFFLQTADVDMTGAEDYEGTHANGNAKCYFGGVYNGGGHTLTVSIEAEGQTSVFPYIYGAIVNLKIKGSINSDTSAQPIRTVQSGAVVANCLFDMVLTASNANAVTYTNYGTVYNVYAAGVATHAAHSSNNGKYYNVFTNVKNASGTVITTSAAVSTADPDTVVAGLSDRESSAAQSGLAALRAVSAALDASALEEFHVKDGEPVFGAAPVMHGDVNRDGALSIEDVTALLDLLASGAEALSRADLNADGRLSIDDVTALLDLLAGGVPNPEEVLLSQEDLALYRGSYNILSDRITDRGFAITSLNGAYIGMFTRDSSIQAMAHIANGDDGAARRILRYLLSYHAALDLKRVTHVIEELREEEYRNNYLEGNGSGEEDAVYDVQTKTGVAQFLVNAPNNTSATPFTTNRRTVTEVSAYLEGVADAEVVAEICEDPKDPSTVLAAGEHVFENSAPGWVVFTLDEAFLPEKGETYYLKIYAPAGNGRVVWYGVNNGATGELRALNYDLAAYGGDGWREVEVYIAFAIGAYGGGEAGSAKIAQRAADVGIYSITAPDHGAAQAFIPQNAYIYSVEAHLDKSSDGDVVKASIRTDYSDPSTTLGEALYTFGARENGWQIITFDEPVQVTPGKTCYLVLQAVNAAGSVVWNGTLSAADVPNSYNYDVPSFGGWVEKPYHPAFEIVSYPASAVARGFEARGGLVTGVDLTVFSAEAGGRIRAEIRTDYRYPSSALCSAEAPIDAAGEKTYPLSFGSVAVTAGGRYYLVVFLEETEDRARLLTDTRAEADTWALGGAWEKIGYDFLATLNFEVDKAPLITLDGAAAGVQEIPASGELITTVKVLLMKDPGAAGTLKATLYKGENVEIDVKTLDLAAVPESTGWVTVSFDLPLFKTPEAGSYFVKLETVGASGKVYWCGSTTVDTLDTYTLTNGTRTAVLGEAGFEALRASLRLYSDYTQTDTTYMLIHAWAMFANKAKKTDENLKFIVDSYPLIKSFANYFIDDPAYMNDSLDLLYNPSLEHSKQGRYWQSYDLITNVFASQALWELSAIAGTMDDATAAQKWLAAARRIEGGINAHLVTDYEGKTIYGEFYDSFDGMTFYPGISWVNFAPVAAEWYAMDVEIMKNTYEVYKEYAGITMLGYPGLSTDATLGADDKRDSLIGKGVAWELMFCDRIGDTDRVKEILALERATAEKYALSCYPESWISQYQVSDPGNQEHCAWQVYAMCAVFPELKSANG